MKKNNKKGFTLVELLAVIVILGLIAVIAAPLVLGTINNSKKSLSKEQENRVVEAAKAYTIKNGHCGCVSVETLYSKGFVESDKISDPKTGNHLNGGVSLKWENNQYVYAYTDSCTETVVEECPTQEEK